MKKSFKNEFKIINPPIEPKKKFRRRKVYGIEESIVEMPDTKRPVEITVIKYKNIFDIKYTAI